MLRSKKCWKITEKFTRAPTCTVNVVSDQIEKKAEKSFEENDRLMAGTRVRSRFYITTHDRIICVPLDDAPVFLTPRLYEFGDALSQLKQVWIFGLFKDNDVLKPSAVLYKIVCEVNTDSDSNFCLICSGEANFSFMTKTSST